MGFVCLTSGYFSVVWNRDVDSELNISRFAHVVTLLAQRCFFCTDLAGSLGNVLNVDKNSSHFFDFI